MHSPKTWLLEKRYRSRLLIVLLLTSILNFMDRAILSAAIEPMRREIGLSDAQIGLLQGVAFGLVYALLALPIGRLAERFSRKVMLACSTLFFSLMSALCGTAGSFGALFFMRAGVGAGEAAFLPPTVSLLSDHYPPERRSSAFSIINLGSPIGYLLGSMVGGTVVALWGWRTAFYLTAIPGVIVAILLLTLLTEPPRGLVEGKAEDKGPPPPLRAVLSRLWGFRSFRHMLAGGAIALAASYAHAQFMFPFFARSQGLSPQMAGVAAGLVGFLSISGGSLLGGYGVDYMRRFDIRWTNWMPVFGLLLASILYGSAYLSHSIALSAAGAIFGGMALFCFYAPTFGNVQNLVPPRMRASSIGLMSLVFGIVGAGLGPTSAGLLSDLYAGNSFGADYKTLCIAGKTTGDMLQRCQSASAQGLRLALASMALLYIWSAFHFWRASRTIREDLLQP